MTRQELKEKISERIGRNLYYMSCVMTNDNVRKELAANNDILNDLLLMIKNGEDVYEKGLNDAWELAQKIGGVNHPDYYGGEELRDIFGSVNCSHVFNHYSYGKALAKVQEYEKKKAEEAKLVPGDVVEYYSIITRTTSPKSFGVFLYEDLINNYYWVLPSYKGCPQQLPKGMFKLRKTGEHINFDYTKIGDSDE